METIFETHLISMRFKIDNNAPPVYESRWHDLKRLCEAGEDTVGNTKRIISGWLSKCKTDAMRNFTYLNRYEGGIIGTADGKQIRFRTYYTIHPYGADDDIVFEPIYNTNDDKWSLVELSDLMYGFIEFANEYVQAVCVRGVIELEKK